MRCVYLYVLMLHIDGRGILYLGTAGSKILENHGNIESWFHIGIKLPSVTLMTLTINSSPSGQMAAKVLYLFFESFPEVFS